MTRAAVFLTDLAHALAASTLYAAGHPARNRAVDAAFRSLSELRAEVPRPSFTFLGDEVVCGTVPCRELRGWEWGVRLADAGIQRLEFEPDVAREDFEGFVLDVHRRLGLAGPDAPSAPAAGTRIRFGAVGVKGEEAPQPVPTAVVSCTLGPEADAMRMIQAQAQTRRLGRVRDAEAIVASLAVTMSGDPTLLPLLRLAGFDQYTTYHALNVATLTMALSQHLGHGARETRALGVAALLHDIGKMKIPIDILTRPSRLEPAELELVQRHPADGARLLLEAGDAPDIAAVVAYEHHVNFDGTGYPVFRYRRRCQFASRLVHLCDVYDALRSPRPYREAWPAPRVLGYIANRAGSEFDPELAPAFIAMMGRIEESPARLDEDHGPQSPDPLRKSA